MADNPSYDKLQEAAFERLLAESGMRPDDTLRRVYGPDDEGVYVEAKLTDEGVIVDVFNDDEFIYTFARTWTEFIDHATETP